VYFGEIHGAGDGAGQEDGSQLIGSGLTVDHGQDGGGVEIVLQRLKPDSF
jgi:hypothetical protein